MVVKSFLKCGISNSMDGTEDDKLYKDFVSLRDGDGGSSVVEHRDNNSYNEDMYNEKITPKEFDQLFGESDDEEFFGF